MIFAKDIVAILTRQEMEKLEKGFSFLMPLLYQHERWPDIHRECQEWGILDFHESLREFVRKALVEAIHGHKRDGNG